MAITSVWLEATHRRRFALGVRQHSDALDVLQRQCALALLAPSQQLGVAIFREPAMFTALDCLFRAFDLPVGPLDKLVDRLQGRRFLPRDAYA